MYILNFSLINIPFGQDNSITVRKTWSLFLSFKSCLKKWRVIHTSNFHISPFLFVYKYVTLYQILISLVRPGRGFEL